MLGLLRGSKNFNRFSVFIIISTNKTCIWTSLKFLLTLNNRIIQNFHYPWVFNSLLTFFSLTWGISQHYLCHINIFLHISTCSITLSTVIPPHQRGLHSHNLSLWECRPHWKLWQKTDLLSTWNIYMVIYKYSLSRIQPQTHPQPIRTASPLKPAGENLCLQCPLPALTELLYTHPIRTCSSRA